MACQRAFPNQTFTPIYGARQCLLHEAPDQPRGRQIAQLDTNSNSMCWNDVLVAELLGQDAKQTIGDSHQKVLAERGAET